MSRKHAVPAVSATSALTASVAVAPAALAGLVTAPAAHASTGITDISAVPAAQVTQDIPHVRPLVTRIIHAAARKSYTIVSGDTLSGIAGRYCGSVKKWPSLWAGNKSQVKNPDMIFPGRKLTLTCHELAAALAQVSPVAATEARTDPFDGHHGNCGDGDGDGMDASCAVIFPGAQSDPAPQRHAAVQATAEVTGASGTLGSGGWPGGAYGACVVARESGGNSQVMNSSGHYGLYQFSEGTWVAYGGPAADFGHASVAEQERVFMTAMAQGGQSNWSPYDGC